MLPYSGDGSSGLAILDLSESERDAYAADTLANHRILRRVIPKSKMRGVLRATLLQHGEPPVPNILHARGEQFVKLCEEQKIRVIVTFGGPALKAVSRLHGKATKLLGSCISGDAVIPKGVKYIIPLDTEASGSRALRSYKFREQLGAFVRRALGLAAVPRPLFKIPKIVTGEGPEALAALAQLQADGDPVALDLETAGDFPNQIITAVGLANKKVAVSVPWTSFTSPTWGFQQGLTDPLIRQAVLDLLAGPLTKVAHNGAFDFTVLQSLGIACGGEWEDTMIAHRINHADLFHNLQFCVAMELPIDPWKTRFEQNRRRRGEATKDWSDLRLPDLLEYNAWDAGVTPYLWEAMEARLWLTENGWENYRAKKALSALFSRMKFYGIGIDENARALALNEVAVRVADIEARWEGLAPGVNPASNKAVSHLLKDVLHAPPVTRSKKTGAMSFPSSTLLEYAYGADAPLNATAWTLFERRKITKARDAFLLALPAHRAHADANVAGTKGARASYSKPNLQQISKPKDLRHPFTGEEKFAVAPALRQLFIPTPGRLMWELDYSALELRLVAYAAGMTDVIDIIADPSKDLHCIHVEMMFNRKVGKKDPLRQIVKTLTYALFYNKKKNVETVFRSLKPSMPSLTLARLEECAERFHAARPQLPGWQDEVEHFIRDHGFVQLPISGERQYHDRKYPDMNQALSYGIQSTGGDIMNAAMLRIQDRLDWENGERLLVQVHDSLVGEAPPDRIVKVLEIVKEEMERPVMLWGQNRVIPVEGGIGENWRDIMDLDKFRAKFPGAGVTG